MARFGQPTSSVFGSMVAGVFQIAFRAEMHANDVFLFFKNHFWHQHIKTIQKVQTALNFSKKKKKNSNLDETQVQTQYQTFPILINLWVFDSKIKKKKKGIYDLNMAMLRASTVEMVFSIKQVSKSNCLRGVITKNLRSA